MVPGASLGFPVGLLLLVCQVEDLADAAGVDPSDVLRVVMADGALCEFRLRFGLAESQDGLLVQARSSVVCVFAVCVAGDGQNDSNCWARSRA